VPIRSVIFHETERKPANPQLACGKFARFLSGTVVAQQCSFLSGIHSNFFEEGFAIMKRIAAVIIGIPLVAAAVLISVPARTVTDDDAAALYNTKCKMCHGATAEKKMDKTKADDALIQTVLDGKTAEKPPNMPAFKDKGLTADQAKALVGYMKSLK